MKLSSKLISSPGRNDNFPPPLMRFLKSNGGSKSRRSRSSPMFVRKKNASIETTQEPTSPKVTCMGQVRVRRSKQAGRKNGRTVAKRCSWVQIQKSLFCNCSSSKKSNPRSSSTDWRSWFSCSQSGYLKKVEIIEDDAKIEPKSEVEEEEVGAEEDDDEEEKEEERENKEFVSSSLPPKNALLLMRCRSDPCRNSSMLNRFWSSEDSETEQNNSAHVENDEEQEENEEPILEKEPICIESTSISRIDPESDEKIGYCESSSSGITNARIQDEEVMKVNGKEEDPSEGAPPPLILTRCKSEPATRSSMNVLVVDTDTGTGTDTDTDTGTCFLKKRNSGFNEQCPSHILLV